MTDKEILVGIKQYFDIRELVSKCVYDKYGNDSWRFLDIRLLHALLIVRQWLNKPIYVNNWAWAKGNEAIFDERGLRANIDDIVKNKTTNNRLYLSAHIFGKAVDFDVEGMTAGQVRRWIDKNKELFPFQLRIEDGVSWVHLDVIQDFKKPKVYFFKI